MQRYIERRIFVVHGVVTLCAAVVLVALPATIPATVGIAVEPEQYLLSYFLAAAELGIGILSLAAIRLHDPEAARLVALCFAAFHGATAILEVVYAITQGPSTMLVVNIGVRILVTIVFVVIARGRTV